MNQSLLQTSAWSLLKTTLNEWTEDNATQLAAALAYYTIFSIAPLLVIVVAVAGAVLGGPEAAHERIVGEIEAYLNNPDAALFLGNMIQQSSKPSASIYASVLSVVVLLYGASGVFGELRSALNKIWDVDPKPMTGIWSRILSHLIPLLMVLVSGFLLLVSLVVSTFLAGATLWIDRWWPGVAGMTQIINFIFFFFITLFVFALIYKYVPDVRIAWRDVWIGAVATALLFSIGRLLISFYLSHSTVTSTYGAAGSLAALLIWIYYSAQVFFLGAEFTQVYGRTLGSRQREQLLLQTEEEEPIAVAGVQTQKIENSVHKQDLMKSKNKPGTMRKATNALADLALAVGILGAISLINLVRPPTRR